MQSMLLEATNKSGRIQVKSRPVCGWFTDCGDSKGTHTSPKTTEWVPQQKESDKLF